MKFCHVKAFFDGSTLNKGTLGCDVASLHVKNVRECRIRSLVYFVYLGVMAGLGMEPQSDV